MQWWQMYVLSLLDVVMLGATNIKVEGDISILEIDSVIVLVGSGPGVVVAQSV